MISIGNPVPGRLYPAGSTPPAGAFRVTQDFGPTSLTVEPALFWPGGDGIEVGFYPHFHPAIDLSDRGCGADVLAVDAGRVTFAGVFTYTEKGVTYRPIVVTIEHAWGTSSNWHLASEGVAVGAKVARGQTIGKVGKTGNTKACHLHFRVTIEGRVRDPWPLFAQIQEDAMLPISDATPKLVTTKAGAVYYDPASGASVSTAASTTARTSPYASGAYRLVSVKRASQPTAQLLGVKSTDPKVTISAVPAPPAPKVLAPGTYTVK